VHVFHAQLSSSPDFSDTEGIDWFVEGLATYASGQLDSLRLKEIKNAIIENNVPASLDSFWTGNFRYGLSGSIVLFIEHKWGRNTLRKLLVFNKKPAILSTLKCRKQNCWVNGKPISRNYNYP